MENADNVFLLRCFLKYTVLRLFTSYINMCAQTAGVAIDGDNPLHVSWIMKKAEERAEEYGITGITYRLTQGT